MGLCLYAGRTNDLAVLEINNGGGETRYSEKVFLVPCRRQIAPRMEEEHKRFLLLQTDEIKMKIKN